LGLKVDVVQLQAEAVVNFSASSLNCPAFYNWRTLWLFIAEFWFFVVLLNLDM